MALAVDLDLTTLWLQGSGLKVMLQQGPYSPAVLRLIESLDAFIDFRFNFQEYLAFQNVGTVCEKVGLQLRGRNTIFSKVNRLLNPALRAKISNDRTSFRDSGYLWMLLRRKSYQISRRKSTMISVRHNIF